MHMHVHTQTHTHMLEGSGGVCTCARPRPRARARCVPYTLAACVLGRVARSNWFIQVAEYYNYKYASGCADPFDPHTAFEELTGDV